MSPDGQFLSGTFAQTQPPEAKRLMASALSQHKRSGAAMRPVPETPIALFGGRDFVPGGIKLQITYRDFPRGDDRRPNTAYIQNPYNIGWFDLSPAEARSLLVESNTPVDVPAPLFRRIATKTLKDAVRGQAGDWKAEHLKAGGLNVRHAGGGKYLLEGSAHLEDGARSYKARLLGRFARGEGDSIDDFELVASGQRTGRHGANGRENDPGPAPMGIAFRQFEPPSGY